MSNTYNKKGKVHSMEGDMNLSAEAQTLFEQYASEAEIPVEDQIINEVEAELCPKCTAALKEAEEFKLRALAEMDNFKKRLQREKEEQAKFAGENILQDIIPAIDNLDLALQYTSNEACQDILIGVQMTRKLLLDSLKNHGLVQISDENGEFNPEIHEAVGQEESELPSNSIVKLLQKGYMLKDRLLRPAKVIVSK